MSARRGDPSSLRWKVAATVAPEMVALALTILLAAAILLVVRFGVPSGHVENRSPAPSAQGRPSGSTSISGIREVGASPGLYLAR